MNTNIQWDELARYFAGELTRQQKDKMESWVQADPERKEKVQKLYNIWKESGATPYQLDTERAWRTLVRNMDKLDSIDQLTDNGLPRTRRGGTEKQYVQNYLKARRTGSTMRRVILTAVAAVVMLTAGIFTYYNYSVESNEAVEIGSRELIAGKGERATYMLNDGSKIILHAGSRLEIPLQFNYEKRELFLEGEAYFEVSHNAQKPFIVHSENAETRVLGTRFLMQAWPDSDNSQVEVIVAEGKVALGSRRAAETGDQNEVIITRNQRGILAGEDAGAVVVDGADMEWYMGWTEGKLVFNDRPFDEIVPKLERWYNIEIKMGEEEMGAKRLTAEVDYSQPMGEVMRGIALTLDFGVEKSGRIFTYYPDSERVNGE